MNKPERNITGEPVDSSHLRAFIERIERLEEERKALASDIKDIYAEAKSAGFDVKVMRQLIRIRKQEPWEFGCWTVTGVFYPKANGACPPLP